MRRLALLLVIGLLSGCPSGPHHLTVQPRVQTNSSGELALIGSQGGLPASIQGKQQLFATRYYAESASCDGAYVGNSFIQIASFFPPGQTIAGL
jgi:hypothetical protein